LSAANVDRLSFCAIPLTFERRADEGVVGAASATGFLWRNNDDWYLITNWHNVTGLNPLTLKHLGSFTPTHVTLGLKYEVMKTDTGQQIGTKNFTMPLYGESGPFWLEHPSKNAVDCVAVGMAIPNVSDLVTKPLNEIEFDHIYRPAVGDECFILGYPKGLKGAGNTPIWKRGSIASEPSLNIAGQPIVLIDSATRSGMSGSPVIARHSGIHMNGLELADDTIFGTVQTFLGIYSGRTDDDELGVQIGRVWKSPVIEQIIQQGSRGRDPVDIAYPKINEN